VKTFPLTQISTKNYTASYEDIKRTFRHVQSHGMRSKKTGKAYDKMVG